MSSSTTTPSEAEIRSLLSQSYAPSQIAPLEAYVTAVAQGQAPYIFDAIRWLLKLYHLFPDAKNATSTTTTADTIMGQAYLLALLQYPNTDLLALSYLIPVKAPQQQQQQQGTGQPDKPAQQQSSSSPVREPFASIRLCADQLDACQFAAFWTTWHDKIVAYPDDPVIAQLAQSSRSLLQRRILETLAGTYRQAPADVVMQALNLTNVQEVASLYKNPTADHTVVERIDADRVVFRPTPDNTKRDRVFQEGVSFTAITHLMSKLAQ